MAKPSAADAHDAGPVWALMAKPSAADAHDARPVWGLMAKPSAADAQLMLMMHGRFGVNGETQCS